MLVHKNTSMDLPSFNVNPATDESGAHSRILLADGDASLREEVRLLLSERFEVHTVVDGISALTAAREQHYDLVLADDMLPQLDGFSLLAAIRDDIALKLTPVILLGCSTQESRVNSLAAGADDYLTKPFSGRELLGRVDALLKLQRARREAEQKIHDSEKRLRLALSAGKLGNWNLDLANMNMTCSDQCKANFGRSPADHFTYEIFRASIHPQDLDMVSERVGRAITEVNDYEADYRCIWPDGSEHWINARAVVITGADGRAAQMIGVTVDITDRKRADELLASDLADTTILRDLSDRLVTEDNIEKMYEEILSAAISIMRSDAGTVQMFDPKNRTLIIIASRGIDRHMADYFYRVGADCQTTCGLALETGKRMFVDYDEDQEIKANRMHFEAGLLSAQSTPLISRTGAQMGMLSTHWRTAKHRPTDRELRFLDLLARQAADLIEQRQADAALREKAERLRTALAAGRMGAWEIDLATGTVTWDEKHQALFDSFLQQSLHTIVDFYALVHPDDISRIKKAAAAANVNGQFSEEFRILRPDGGHRWINARGTILTDQQGPPTRMIGVYYDITERKETEERLAQFTEELEHQVCERTQALTNSQTQLRALATELNLAEQRERTRLATDLHDHLQQLLVLGKLTVGQAKRLAQPIPSCVDMLTKTDDVLVEALKYTRTLVADLSPPILREHGFAARLKWLAEYMRRHDMDVTLDIAEGSDDLRLPEDQEILLFQSARELLINASKHAQSQTVTLKLYKAQDALWIEVSDHGVGFDLSAASLPTPLSSKFGLSRFKSG